MLKNKPNKMKITDYNVTYLSHCITTEIFKKNDFSIKVILILN